MAFSSQLISANGTYALYSGTPSNATMTVTFNTPTVSAWPVGVVFTILVAISPLGALVADETYSNYSSSMQDVIRYAGFVSLRVTGVTPGNPATYLIAQYNTVGNL
jgi:hypothetical protein